SADRDGDVIGYGVRKARGGCRDAVDANVEGWDLVVTCLVRVDLRNCAGRLVGDGHHSANDSGSALVSNRSDQAPVIVLGVEKNATEEKYDGRQKLGYSYKFIC